MTVDQFVDAVLSFLDQFIERRAASDVHELRGSLAQSSETSDRLRTQVTVDEPTAQEGSVAMAAFFEDRVGTPQGSIERVYRRSGRSRVVDVMERKRAGLDPDLRPGTVDDWLSSISRARARELFGLARPERGLLGAPAFTNDA